MYKKVFQLVWFKRILVLLFLFSGFILFFSLNGSLYLSTDNISKIYDNLVEYINKNYVFSIIMLSIIYITTVFFSIPIKPLLKISVGLLFGLWLGFVICLISATIGAMLTFLFVKYSWGAIEESKYQVVSRFKSLVIRQPVSTLLIARVLPIPFFVPNILAGILAVKNSIFFFTTLIGIIPVTFIYVWFGTHFEQALIGNTLDTLIDAKFILAVVVLTLLALVPILIKVRFNFNK